MADRLIEMRAVADMPGTSMRIASEDLRGIVARIDAQAAEIERMRGALAEIHGQFIHGSRQLYTSPDSTLDRIRATAASALRST